ncbi:MAG: hypothetical protein AABX84_02815, partial [Nanoarchaeota archaeon]
IFGGIERYYGPESVETFRPMSADDIQREIERDKESIRILEKHLQETGDTFYRKRRKEVLGKIRFFKKFFEIQ